MKNFILLALSILMFSTVQAQEETVEQLKAQKAEKSAELAKLQGEVGALTAKINTYPGWKFSGQGNVGFNLSQFKDWLGSANPHARSTSIGLAASATANLDQTKYFWKNSGNLIYTKTKLIPNNNAIEKSDFETTADAISVSSLFGYKLTEKFAISALGEYRSTIENINDPGYMDLGVGGTWTPIANLVVVIHPLNYNFVFASDDVAYQSSVGAKIVADYSRKLPMGIAWKSNFSTFFSYENTDLSNWTWVNGVSFTTWKGIGVGFDLGLRQSKQEAVGVARAAEEAAGGDPTTTLDNVEDNPLQSYWLLGLTYSF